MSPEEFDLLAENIDDVGFLDPILVVPLPNGKFRIIDGEHRFEQQRLSDAALVKCVVADPEILDETKQKFQTVRFNKIRGKLNYKKFNELVEDLMQSGEYTYDELAHELGFADEDEFEAMLDSARESLPSEEMKEEFDKAREEIKTVDDLSLVLNRLFTKYGDTLPANFMILDFGGKEHIWVRMPPREYKKIKDKVRECMAYGYKFDSVLSHMLTILPVGKFIEKYSDLLEEVDVSQGTMTDVVEVNDAE